MIARFWRWFKGTSMPFWTKRVLARPGEPAYMVRYHLFVSRWITLYLNKILTKDNDPRLHTHPWKRAYSLKLRGGYWEELDAPGFARCEGDVGLAHSLEKGLVLIHHPRRWSRIPERHRIVQLDGGEPVWTLFIALGPKTPWGFMNHDGTLEVRR